MKFTNISAGPRGLNTKTGTVLVDPRQTVDVDIETAEKKIALGSGWFVDGDAPPEPVGEDVTALKAQLTERDSTITDLNKAITDRDEEIGRLKTQLAAFEGEQSPDYEAMKRDELDALAAERGVDISEAKNKGDVIAALQLADEKAKG